LDGGEVEKEDWDWKVGLLLRKDLVAEIDGMMVRVRRRRRG
jgi:hypothetical protein